MAQNTGLDRQQLSYCVSLIENGANPEALAVRQFPVHYCRTSLRRAPLCGYRKTSNYGGLSLIQAQNVIRQLREEYAVEDVAGGAEQVRAGAR